MPSAPELQTDTRDHDDPTNVAIDVDTASAPSAQSVSKVSETTSRREGHIGRVVAGALIFGVLASLVLVVGPLAGAREHVITGSVLFAFAVAWAMLAVFSQRWTNQPQRWAIVPATVMAVAGGSIVAFAPTGNELGWVWPPMLVMLVIWMIVRTRHDLHSRTRIWLLYPVFAAMALSAVGGGYETYRESTDRAAYPMPGRLIDVGRVERLVERADRRRE